MSITCDNASSNDKMIDKLARQLEEFPGTPNRACYFTHILNLVVKSIMQQFDVPRKRLGIMEERTHNELLKLAGNIEVEELETQTKEEDCQEETEGVDNDEGWIDKRDDMTEEELDDLDENLQPIWFVLTKVSQTSKVLYSIS